MGKILVIDDEKYIGWVIKKSFEPTNHVVNLCLDGQTGINEIEKNNYDLLYLDLRLPDIDGMEVLQRVKKIQEDLMVIIITAYGSIGTAIESMKNGAFDYVTKPFDIDEILLLADKAMELRRLKKEVSYLRSESVKDFYDLNFTSKNNDFNEILESLPRISATAANVLITGESGTGKQLIARRIHKLSDRENYPFIFVECSTLKDGSFESELFDYDRGTLYFRGVDSMNIDLQNNLLDFILRNESKDTEIIASSKRDLKQSIENGEFREDLYYKLNVIPISIPPLRNRREDIKDLVDLFIKKYDRSNHIRGITPEAIKLLKNYSWPGNIRELENIIERITILNQESVIRASVLPAEILGEVKNARDPIIYFPEEGINLDKVEKDLIIKALNISGQNQSKAAQLLGITRSALIYRMQKHGIN